MTLKYKLDSLEGLDEATQKLYVKSGDKFVLTVEGLEDGDVAGLKNQVNQLLSENKDAKKKLKDIQDAQSTEAEKARKAAEDAARAAGDVEKLEKSWKEKHEKALADKDGEYKPQVESLTKDVERLLVDNVAREIARDIALQGSDSILIPHIKQRLRVDIRDGRRVTVVVDGEGKPSASTVDELKKEFVGNAAFAPVIAGSKGSGGGAGGNQQKGGGAAGAKSIKRTDFDALDPASQVKHIKEGGTVTD